LVVFTTPIAGSEEEFNDWYQNVHLRDVVAVPGFTSAQRFRLAKSMSAEEPLPYLAIYDVETDDIEGVIAGMKSRVGTEAMVISDAMNRKASAAIFEEFGPLVAAKHC
jgi:hypothetical protein